MHVSKATKAARGGSDAGRVFFNDIYEADAAVQPTRSAAELHKGDLAVPPVEVRSASGDAQRHVDEDDDPIVTHHIYKQLLAVYGSIVAHIVVMACTDPVLSSSPVTHVLVFGLQLFLLLASAIAFFLLTSQTLFVRVGLYQRYMSHYRWTFTTFLLAAAFLVVTRSYNLAMVYGGHTSPAILRNASYYIVWMIQRLTLLLFYCTISCASARTLTPQLFSPRCLGR